MARDREATSPAEPPEELLRYDESDWSGWEPNPAKPGALAPVRPHIQWSAARYEWIKQHVSTQEEFDRLFLADDVVFPPGVDPEIERDLACIFRREWSTWRRPDDDAA